jgi:hypothetical protein
MRLRVCRAGRAFGKPLTADLSKGKRFFFEKKQQKTFAHWPRARTPPGASTKSFFCFFFVHKKEVLSSLSPRPNAAVIARLMQ